MPLQLQSAVSTHKHTMCCTACGGSFTNYHYLQSHLLQTNNLTCQEVLYWQNEQRLAEILDEDDLMDLDKDNVEEPLHPFEGNFFGSDYGPEDFANSFSNNEGQRWF